MNSESSRVAKVPNATFEKHQEAKLNEILNSQMNEKKNKRQQTLITNFIRKENDRHEATQQAFMNENISDEDSMMMCCQIMCLMMIMMHVHLRDGNMKRLKLSELTNKPEKSKVNTTAAHPTWAPAPRFSAHLFLNCKFIYVFVGLILSTSSIIHIVV